MLGNGSPAVQLLGCQTTHHGEAGNISETWQAQRWHTSPRCKVTGVPLCCSSLTCTCWALKAPDLIHKGWKVCPTLAPSDQAVQLPMPIRYVLLLEGIWIKHLSIWQACSSMKTCYELSNHIFNCAACQKSAQTSNSKEMRSFWSTAKISTFPLLVLDAAPPHSTMCDKLWEGGAVSQKRK